MLWCRHGLTSSFTPSNPVPATEPSRAQRAVQVIAKEGTNRAPEQVEAKKKRPQARPPEPARLPRRARSQKKKRRTIGEALWGDSMEGEDAEAPSVEEARKSLREQEATKAHYSLDLRLTPAEFWRYRHMPVGSVFLCWVH